MKAKALKRFDFATSIIEKLNECTEGTWEMVTNNAKGTSDYISINTVYKYGENLNQKLDFTLVVGQIHYSPDGADFADLMYRYDYGVDAVLVLKQGELNIEQLYHEINDFLNYYAA